MHGMMNCYHQGIKRLKLIAKCDEKRWWKTNNPKKSKKEVSIEKFMANYSDLSIVLDCRERNVAFFKRKLYYKKNNDKTSIQEVISVTLDDISPTSTRSCQSWRTLLAATRRSWIAKFSHPRGFWFFLSDASTKKRGSLVAGRQGCMASEIVVSSPNPQIFAARFSQHSVGRCRGRGSFLLCSLLVDEVLGPRGSFDLFRSLL